MVQIESNQVFATIIQFKLRNYSGEISCSWKIRDEMLLLFYSQIWQLLKLKKPLALPNIPADDEATHAGCKDCAPNRFCPCSLSSDRIVSKYGLLCFAVRPVGPSNERMPDHFECRVTALNHATQRTTKASFDLRT